MLTKLLIIIVALWPTVFTAPIPNDIANDQDFSDGYVRHNKQHALKAFDCSQPTNIRDKTFEIPQRCLQTEPIVNVQNKTYTIMHKETFRKLEGYYCEILMTQTMAYCGTYDHMTLMLGPGTFHNKPMTLNEKQCRTMIDDGKISYQQLVETGSKDPNSELILHIDKAPGINRYSYFNFGNVYIANSHVHCDGAKLYVNGVRKYVDSAVSHTELVITIQKDTFTIDTESTPKRMISAETNVELGSACSAESGFCFTNGKAYVWNYTAIWCPLATGKTFQGIHITDRGNNSAILSTDGNLLKFVIEESDVFCDQVVLTTNYPDIYLIESATFPTDRALDSMNTYLFTFIANRDSRMWHDVTEYVAKEFQEILQNDCFTRYSFKHTFSFLAGHQPSIVPWVFNNGTFATVAGETLYYYDCAPVLVYPVEREIQTCHEDLEVFVPHHNDSQKGDIKYLERLTHRLSDIIIEIPCDDVFLPKYQTTSGKWITMRNGAMLTVAPGTQPAVQPKWNAYHNIPIKDYAQGGVYTRQQLINMQKAITFGRSQSALSHKFTLQYTPGNTGDGHLSPTEIFPNSQDWVAITSGGIFGAFWSLFNWWAGILTYGTTVYFTYKFITWLISLCYSIKILKPLYGFVQSCFWSMVPNVFIAAQHREIFEDDAEAPQAPLRNQRMRQRRNQMDRPAVPPPEPPIPPQQNLYPAAQ